MRCEIPRGVHIQPNGPQTGSDHRQVEHASEFASLEISAYALNGGIVNEDMADHQYALMLLREHAEFFGLFAVVGDGLLDEDMLFRVECGPDELVMRDRRCGNNNRVDTAVAYRLGAIVS